MEDRAAADSWKMQEIIEVIMRNAYRLHQLTEDILDVTKIKTGPLKLRMEDLNLREIIDPLVVSFTNELEDMRNENKNDVKISYRMKATVC